jgi:hypothetical protein
MVIVPGNVHVAVATPDPPVATPLLPEVLVRVTINPGSPKYAAGLTTGVKLVTVTVKISGVPGGMGGHNTAVQTLGVQTIGFSTILGTGCMGV